MLRYMYQNFFPIVGNPPEDKKVTVKETVAERVIIFTFVMSPKAVLFLVTGALFGDISDTLRFPVLPLPFFKWLG